MDLLEKRFSQIDVLKAVPGLRPDLLQLWIKRGHVELSDKTPGTGRRRSWSALEVVKAATIFELAEMNFEVSFAKKGADMVADYVTAVVAGDRPANEGDMFLVIIRDRIGDDKYHMTMVSQVMVNEHEGNIGRALGMGFQPTVIQISIDELLDSVVKVLFPAKPNRPNSTDGKV